MNKIVMLLVCVFCLSLVSCFETSPPDGYLAVDSTSAFFIQFTTVNQQLSGHIQGIEETNDPPPQTKSSSTAFTGTQNGSSITITISIFGFSSSVTGTLNGDTLTLQVPQADGHLQSETFHGASIQQYNQAVDALQRKVGLLDQQYANNQATATAIQATQTAQQQEQYAVSKANTTLSNALSTLKSDAAALASFSETSTLNSYASSWKTMQKDYATEQKDAQAGCGDGNYNYGTVQYDAGSVDYDAGSVQYDDGSLGYDKNTYESELAAVQQDIQAVKDAWAQLQAAVANNPTNTPAAAYTSDDVNHALQDAQSAENIAGSTWQSAQSQAAQYDQEAHDLQKKADAIPANMHCG